MRKAVPILALVALAHWLARRRRGSRHAAEQTVSIGYVDGSSATLEPGSREHELLVETASEAW